jgi:hypothetical protein
MTSFFKHMQTGFKKVILGFIFQIKLMYHFLVELKFCVRIELHIKQLY